MIVLLKVVWVFSQAISSSLLILSSAASNMLVKPSIFNSNCWNFYFKNSFLLLFFIPPMSPLSFLFLKDKLIFCFLYIEI
jgi:hypothetical protein